MRPILCFLPLFFVVSASFANNNDFFEIDETSYSKDITKLEELENYVVESNTTVKDLALDQSFRLTSNRIRPSYSITESVALGEKALGIPSFAWGFCFGATGLIIVYILTDDKEEAKKALYGCITSTAIFSVLYVAVIASTTVTTY